MLGIYLQQNSPQSYQQNSLQGMDRFDEKEGYCKIVYEDKDSKELDKNKVTESLDITQI